MIQAFCFSLVWGHQGLNMIRTLIFFTGHFALLVYGPDDFDIIQAFLLGKWFINTVFLIFVIIQPEL